jgi:hypothetical protein
MKLTKLKFDFSMRYLIYGKRIEKPLKLLVKAFPIPRIALQPDKENTRHIARNIRYLSFVNIRPPLNSLTYIITGFSYMCKGLDKIS